MKDNQGDQDQRELKEQKFLIEDRIFELHREAIKKYEEYVRLSELADLSDHKDIEHPRYLWDGPIGIVIGDS